MKVNKSIVYFNPKGIKLSTKPSDEQKFINNSNSNYEKIFNRLDFYILFGFKYNFIFFA